MKKKVLFICVHNSARSQMAEAWLNQTRGKFFEAQSAGLEAETINPLVVEAMREVGIDLSNKNCANGVRRLEVRPEVSIRHHCLR